MVNYEGTQKRLKNPHPFVLDEALVNFSLSGHDALAELLPIPLASEVQCPVQVEVVGL